MTLRCSSQPLAGFFRSVYQRLDLGERSVWEMELLRGQSPLERRECRSGELTRRAGAARVLGDQTVTPAYLEDRLQEQGQSFVDDLLRLSPS